MTFSNAAAFVSAFFSLTTPALGQSLRLTFSEAVEQSEKHGLAIAGAEHAVTAAKERQSGTSAEQFPKLRAEANLLRWNTPIRIDLSSNGGPPGTDDTLVVRERYTSQLSISLVQPISGLFLLHHKVAMERRALDVAKTAVMQARLDTTQSAAQAYVRLLRAQASKSVAEKSLAQIEAQLARARTLEQSGVLGKVDVLRWISTRDAAHVTLVRAKTDVSIAMGALSLALSLSPDTKIEVVDDFPDPPPPVLGSEADVQNKAMENRPEIQGAAVRTEQAKKSKTVAWAGWLPNILGIVNYQLTEGQGPFQEPKAWYIGLTLNWDVWDWGKTLSSVREAGARIAEAQSTAQLTSEQIAFEARQRLWEAKAAYESLAPARSSQEAAEEAHRIQTLRYTEGTASTTDVIESETELYRARAGYTQSRYDYYLAQTALARAVGNLPSFKPGNPRPASHPPGTPGPHE